MSLDAIVADEFGTVGAVAGGDGIVATAAAFQFRVGGFGGGLILWSRF